MLAKKGSKAMVIRSKYFYGNKISEYGLENGYVDYSTLAKSFDAVLNNTIINKGWELGEWEQISGFVNNSDEIDELKEQIEELEDLITEEKDEAITEKIHELEEKIEELEEEEDYQPEVYQWYIVSDNAIEILEEANEVVYYNDALDMYLWGVTHYGTSWAYVLTDIRIDW